MGHGDAALGHHGGQIAIAEPVPDVPPDTLLNDVDGEAAAAVDRVALGCLGHSSLPLAGPRVWRISANAPEPIRTPTARWLSPNNRISQQTLFIERSSACALEQPAVERDRTRMAERTGLEPATPGVTGGFVIFLETVNIITVIYITVI